MITLFKKTRVRKFLLRWMVVNVVYLLIKASVDHDGKGFSSFLEPTPIFYYVTAFLFFMVAWEYNDRLIYRQLKHSGLNLKNSLTIFVKTMLVLVPLTTVIYYLALFPLRDFMGIICQDPPLEFRA
ncbi:MAG: hypothetical protein AAGA43_16755, partial [Bacteroidota bacterium]